MLLAIKCDTFNNNAILIPLLLVPCGKFCIFWWSWWALLSHWKNVHDKRKITFSVFFMDIMKHIIWKFPFEITAVLGVYTLWFKICYVHMVLNQYLFTVLRAYAEFYISMFTLYLFVYIIYFSCMNVHSGCLLSFQWFGWLCCLCTFNLPCFFFLFCHQKFCKAIFTFALFPSLQSSFVICRLVFMPKFTRICIFQV